MAETQTPAGGRLVTEHEDADKAIKTLREIATVLKLVGNENVELSLRVDEGASRISELEGQLKQLEDEELEELALLRESVRDFQRGIIDQAELVTRASEE